MGSGAVYFYLAQKYSFEKMVLSDVNKDLILTYQAVRNELDPLIDHLKKMEKKYLNASDEARKRYYYDTRRNFNKNSSGPHPARDQKRNPKRAAQVIFLNRTCYNGLFRLNSRGEFNTPPGIYKRPKICDASNLELVSELLRRTVIKKADFKTACKNIRSFSFVYFDPPYRPLSKTANFTSYSKNAFTDKDQGELAVVCRRLSRENVRLMLSNSDPKNLDPSDHFFEGLYGSSPFSISRVPAKRLINSNSRARGPIHELLIKNY